MLIALLAAVWPHTLRWRLTLWYAATLAVGLSLFAAASYVVTNRILNTRADRFLRDARGGFLVELAVEAAEYPADDDAIRMAVQEVRFEETRFVVYDATGRVVASTAEHLPEGSVATASTSTNIPWHREPVPELDTAALRSVFSEYARRSARSDELVTIATPETEYRVEVGGASVHGNHHTVLAVQDRTEHHDTMHRVLIGYALCIPIFISMSVAGGYLLARRALGPVAEMAKQAHAISAATLHERLPVGNARDELGDLATVVNALLSRLEQSFAQQIRFVADASHELRTPVAILLAESDVALAREHRAEAEYRDALKVVNKSSQRLSRIVEDLFLLARVDAGHMTVQKEPLYLDEVIADSVRALRSVATRANVTLTFSSEMGEQGAPCNGSPALLDRLVLNLIDNAIKHSPAEGVVHVSLSRADGIYQIDVSDQGAGIPLSAQSYIFDRFYRVDGSRTRSKPASGDSPADDASIEAPDHRVESAERIVATGGAGLGLAIARWIAEAHGGTIVLWYSTSIGTMFRVSLPAPETA